MISKPEDVYFDDNWAGTSFDRWGNEHDNLESSMDWQEHQRLVFAAKGILAGNIAIANAQAKALFEDLKTAYTDSTGNWTISVSKGIHQPTTDPHLQLNVSETRRRYTSSRRYHLNLSAIDTAERSDSFQWKGVQFSAELNGVFYRWPVSAPYNVKKTDRARRNSISAVDLAKHVQDLENERKKVEAEKAAKSNDAIWTKFIAENKLDKKATPTKKFFKGENAQVVNGNSGKWHIKFFPTENTIKRMQSNGQAVYV